MQVRVGAQTNVGCVRTHNEDAFGVFPEEQLYVVADGMGGHNAGEVASGLAVEAIRGSIRTARDPNATQPLSVSGGRNDHGAMLVGAIRKANAVVVAQSIGASAGMGTTVVAALVDSTTDTLHVAHVGDSRCYRVRAGTIDLLTRDHSLVNQYRDAVPEASERDLAAVPHNVITRAVGMDHQIEVDVAAHAIEAGDVVVLASDGLSGIVSDEEIRTIVSMDEPAEERAERLVACANEHGGDDNVTVVVLAFE